MSKGWSTFWIVCRIINQNGEEITLAPIGQKYARRQWAMEALMTLMEDDPEVGGGPYCIVETDDNWRWDVGSYGPRGKAQKAAAMAGQGR